MKRTKDEIFLLKLFALALEKGTPWEGVDRYLIGDVMGESPRVVDNIVRHLAQANFVKKGDAECVYLTQNGFNLVQLLEEES